MDHPHHEMPMIEPTAADSFTLKASPLPRAGWTATASDQAPAYPAGNVIDAGTATIWHSAYASQPAPLPHSVTVDMHQVRSVSGLTYLPRQDAPANGTIGRYSISLQLRRRELGVAGHHRDVGGRPQPQDRGVPRRGLPVRAADRAVGGPATAARGRRPRTSD